MKDFSFTARLDSQSRLDQIFVNDKKALQIIYLTGNVSTYKFTRETTKLPPDAQALLRSIVQTFILDPKTSPIKLLDSGTRKNFFVEALQNGYVTLYTVPANKIFYLLSYDLNAMPTIAGAAYAAAIFYAVDDDLCHLTGGAGGTGMHTQNSFTLLRLEAGITLNAWAEIGTTAAAEVQGVEFDA